MKDFQGFNYLERKSYIYQGKSWKVERYGYKSCSECGYPLVAMDPIR
jgi:hypothetical protein